MPYIGRVKDWGTLTVFGLSFRRHRRRRLYYIAYGEVGATSRGWSRGVLRGDQGVYS